MISTHNVYRLAAYNYIQTVADYKAKRVELMRSARACLYMVIYFGEGKKGQALKDEIVDIAKQHELPVREDTARNTLRIKKPSTKH